jgi:GNAT superfamily N-acetyltransferase
MRQMTPENFPEVLPLFRKFIDALNHPAIVLDEGYAADFWSKMIAAQVGVVLGVYDDGKPIGTVAAFITPDQFNPVPICQEAIFWVEPEYRQKGPGKWLMQSLENLAKGRGCNRIAFSALNVFDSNADKRYVKQGFHPFDTQFMKMLEDK